MNQRLKAMISGKAKKFSQLQLFIKNLFTSKTCSQGISQPCMIGFVTWPPFCTIIIYVKGGQVTKPIMHGCEIPCEHVFEVKRFLINNCNWLNFLALPDIIAFSR